jgi:hypothetical protein
MFVDLDHDEQLMPAGWRDHAVPSLEGELV